MVLEKTVLDLSRYFDGRGLQPPDETGEYGFNIWSNTFPAEELPAPGSAVVVDGVPFAFPGRGAGGADNLRCRGQFVEFPAGSYDWIYLLGAAERRTEDRVSLCYADGSEKHAWLRMSDFWPETPARFGEPLAFATSALRYPRHTQASHSPSIWQQRIPLTTAAPLTGVRLPDNPAMHVFAMTAVTDQEARHAS
jgi:hypothetical protein